MIAPGSRLGSYEVTALIGSGGMGEVYRGRDPRLSRDVAIKVLPRAVSGDADRQARFEREARVLASLNHPHIAAIYGVEQAGDVRALVLELVEGPTLAERIRRGPLPLEEAVSTARQIADALAAAHEKGIVHRDLKPANVKLTRDGTVKVLDFGLAKALVGSGEGEGSDLPTVTGFDTREGVILGTAPYMSPEQARGQRTDEQTDIWAFGCVFYEMLTGRPCFAGATLSDTLAAILQAEPDWTELGHLPGGIRRIVRRCLAKDPKRRFRDIGDVRIDLEDALESPLAPAARPPRASWLRAVPWAVAAACALALALSVRVGRVPRSGAAPVTRATIALPAGQELDTGAGAEPLALSPDGGRLAYVAYSGGRRHLYLRDLDAFGARPVADSEGAQHPFFSPDGKSVAFFAGGKLKRVAVQGGAPVTVCDAPQWIRGGSWGTDDTIVFGSGEAGLARVSASGGAAVRLTTAYPKADRRPPIWPHVLPNGRGLLATAGQAVDSALLLLSPEGGGVRELVLGFQAQYVTSGHLVFHASAVREGELQAVRFDLARLALRGAPTAVLDGVFRSENGGGAYFAVSPGGTLVFARGGHARTLVSVDRNGRRTRLLEDRRGYRMPRLSPDGRYAAVTIDPRPSQVWVYDLARRSGVPLAAEGHNLSPAWTPDGRRVTYTTRREMYVRTADGSGEAVPVLARERPQYANAWTRDGRFLVFTDDHPTNRGDIWLLPVGGEPRPLVATAAQEGDARLSPDEHWLAYTSDESGRFEVYVRPFPNVEAGKWLVSTGGGTYCAWSPDGRELFYLNGAAMMSVAVKPRGGAFDAATPEQMFTGPFETGSPQFDVSPDGKSFVMVEADPDAKPTAIELVLNWSEELNRLVP